MNEPIEPQLIEALRRDRELSPPDDAQARIAARLGILAPISAIRPAEPSARAAPSGSLRRAAAVAATFLLGAASGALLHARWTAHSAAPTALGETPTAPEASFAAPSPVEATWRPPLALPVTAAPSSSEPHAPPAATVAPPPSPGPSPPRRPLHLAQLDAERAVLDAARIALVSGDPDQALSALDQHAKSFSRPMLGEEHDALLVQALVRAGRYDEARARAEDFRRKAPGSLLGHAVEAAIASIPQ